MPLHNHFRGGKTRSKRTRHRKKLSKSRRGRYSRYRSAGHPDTLPNNERYEQKEKDPFFRENYSNQVRSRKLEHRPKDGKKPTDPLKRDRHHLLSQYITRQTRFNKEADEIFTTIMNDNMQNTEQRDKYIKLFTSDLDLPDYSGKYLALILLETMIQRGWKIPSETVSPRQRELSLVYFFFFCIDGE